MLRYATPTGLILQLSSTAGHTLSVKLHGSEMVFELTGNDGGGQTTESPLLQAHVWIDIVSAPVN